MEDCAGGREAGVPAAERSLCAAVYTALTLNRELGTKRRCLVCFSAPSRTPRRDRPARGARDEGASYRLHRGKAPGTGAGGQEKPQCPALSNSTFTCSFHIFLQGINHPQSSQVRHYYFIHIYIHTHTFIYIYS